MKDKKGITNNLKLQLLAQLQECFKASGLKQSELAAICETTQCRISHVINNKFEEFTISTLVVILFHMGYHVDFTVRKNYPDIKFVDESVRMLDPFSKTLSAEEQVKITKETQVNPEYFHKVLTVKKRS